MCLILFGTNGADVLTSKLYQDHLKRNFGITYSINMKQVFLNVLYEKGLKRCLCGGLLDFLDTGPESQFGR